MPKPTCIGCNRSFSSTYTLKRHNTSSKCASAQNETMFKTTTKDDAIARLERKLSEMEEKYEKQISNLVLQIKELKASKKQREIKSKDGDNTNLPMKLPKKLQTLDIEKIEPFTREFIQDHLSRFTISTFKKGPRGVAEFILRLAKQNGSDPGSKSIVCTDGSRNKFYVVSSGISAVDKQWTLDNGGLNIINFVLDELRSLAGEYLSSIESEDDDQFDKYVGFYDGFFHDMGEPIRDKTSIKVRTLLKEHLCI